LRCHDFTNAIVRTPAQSVVDGLRSHDGPGPGHAEVLAEHRAYVAALEAAGVAVETLPPLEEYPDSVFVEDPALVFGEGAILLRPGAATRIGETREMLPVLERNFADVQILEAGFADGGDIMVTPDAVLIGLSARTDEAGAHSLAGALERLGRRSRIVTPPEGALHLKTIASMIDEETILTTRAGAASGIFAGFRLVLVDPPEEPAANALRINGTLLLSAGHPRIAEMLDSLGYALKLIDTDHIARIDAGLSCMSLRWRR
jgi:dimethylargininase